MPFINLMQFYAPDKTLSIWKKFQITGDFPWNLRNNPISNYYGGIFDHILEADERYLVMQIPPRQWLYWEDQLVILPRE